MEEMLDARELFFWGFFCLEALNFQITFQIHTRENGFKLEH